MLSFWLTYAAAARHGAVMSEAFNLARSILHGNAAMIEIVEDQYVSARAIYRSVPARRPSRAPLGRRMRTPSVFKLPSNLKLTDYRRAASMDAADWMLNVSIRAYLFRSNDLVIERLLGLHGPLIDGLNRPFLASVEELRFDPHPKRQGLIGGFLPLLRAIPDCPSSVASLSVNELYFRERLLPKTIRNFGSAIAGGSIAKHLRMPDEFDSTVDEAIDPQLIHRVVRIDLAQTNATLKVDFESFLRVERARIKTLDPKAPFARAVREVESRRPRSDMLVRLAEARVLPYMDLVRWMRSQQIEKPDDAAVQRALEVRTRKAFLETTVGYAAFFENPLVVTPFFGPIVRKMRTQASRKAAP